MLESKFKHDDGLRDMLKKPLREINIFANLKFSGDNLMCATTQSESSLDGPVKFDWSPFYQETDKRQDELSSTDTE